MPDFSGSKTQKPRCRQRQRGSKTKKGTNTTANPSYVLRKFFFPHLLYILYHIFRRAQIFVGFFFAVAGGLVLPVVFCGLNFCKKISRAKHAQPYNAPWKKPLLPRIKYNTKCVKLQELNYIYSIPYFTQNTTAKPQNLPATAPCRFVLTGSASGKYIVSHNCSSAGKQKKEAPLMRRIMFQSKNFGLQELFSSTCSMHAFISAASVRKSFSRTTSTSSTLCRSSFR